MKVAQHADNISIAENSIDKLYMENTLLRVAGALFCHDAKRAPTHTKQIELNKGVLEKRIIIRPDPELGQPGPLAHKLFVALIKKHSGYGRPIRNEVSFTKRELMRLIGRTEWGGSASEQLMRALREIHYTFITTNFKANNGRFAEHSFNIFPEIYLERAEHASDPIEACTVTLGRPIVASLQEGHFTCLNHALMQELGTIGQAFYMRLFFHFANLYDGHHKNRLSFFKRYDDICAEWLGGLTVHQYQSNIERDQLGPHLRQLVRVGFLASYTVTNARSGEGFIITLRPGSVFFTDYDRFYRRRKTGAVRFDFHDDRQGVAEPLKVAYLFMEKRLGQTIKDVPYVSSKEVQTARQLLMQMSFDEIPSFVDYALAQAKKTNYSVQSLGGIRQYLTDYLQARDRLTAVQAAHTARQAEEKATQERMDYDRFRRAQADRVFASLGGREQAAIKAVARTKTPARLRGGGSLAEIIFGIDRARITAERHPNKISSFKEWKAKRLEQ
jgi:hypothetical protein